MSAGNLSEHCCVTKIYSFSAGHRLSIERLTAEENSKVFGKCSNPRGHGHDYYLEVRVEGKISPDTGMIVHLNDLDSSVNNIISELDHKRLDIEVEYFSENQSTGENIVRFFWVKLSGNVEGCRLVYLKLWETGNNYFEYFEEKDIKYAN
ncbi:MAG: 6-carboxytetrahydropterin synthase [Candidatus Dadabacteria bacterium]|nr:6-carboxytetrahydropterin synthase [Candidatus Dadabacteria bacterium]NIS09242.1 6-carboxytetrahydropterin synthase [Candidatus Dadabacteria bacterium]NIV41890.1 6-carboxytetrahydropterin synthase [Candidatus Dadabacteria bacterium]NIX15788.1 6-carboxytetrahydropterin synthase [Candidatus Dadabacteria bacterium]NIY22518.1 6-carboxytetrahydropterin synthase [Candidatus Dadabacteria bacterium]